MVLLCHACIPPCPPHVMTMNLFALRHHRRPSLLRMFCVLYRIVLQCLLPLFLYSHAPIVKCYHNGSNFSPMSFILINYINTTIAGAFTTPYLGACIAQFEILALLIICL
jgi:hypothetical protein